jgi:soluble lytic murein transglycosylase-like protein
MPRRVIVLALVAAAFGGCEGQQPAQAPPPQPEVALPAPDAPLPRQPRELAGALADTSERLRAAAGAWRASGGEPPEAVTLLALHQQRIYLRLGSRPGLARRTLARLPRPVAADARDIVHARRALASIRSVVRSRPKIRVGPARPADELLRHYRRAQRRFGVGWPLLAAVNFVESAFGRLRNTSVSGAQGPMQFMPATWDAYGLGGDVHDPRDAILGAANYLHASGAPRDERAALYAYNPSRHYVSAIARYARVIRRDRRAFYELYAWQVFVRDGRGYRRLTGPGRTSTAAR